jgi:plastocyanin
MRTRRLFIIPLALLLSAAALPALAGTATVHVGLGGTKFVDEVSGTNVTTIHAGDSVTWVWEGDMAHSVTSGTCPDNSGGGGGGYGGYVGSGGAMSETYGGGSCTPSTDWTSVGPQATGSFSHTFPTAGTFKYYCQIHGSAMTGKVVVQPATASGPCVASGEQLCLNGGRFAVTAEWTRTDGSSGHGTGIGLTGDSGYFWFFDPTNIEVTVKVLDGCSVNGNHWVFAAGLTNVQVELKVIDTQTGVEYDKENPQGTAFVPIQDTGAFPSSCS